MIEGIVDTEDQIPEGLKDFYVAQDGKYQLQVKGFKPESEFSKVQAASNKLQADHKALADRYSVLGDKDPKEILSMLDRLPELEAAAKGGDSEEKVKSLVEARIKSHTAPLERERDSLAKQVQSYAAKIEEYTQKERLRSIHDNVRSAAVDAKTLPNAIDDIVALSERIFDVNEDGSVTTKDGLDAKMWLKDMQSQKPYYWPASQGGGATGGSGAGGATGNPWSEGSWNITQQMQIASQDRGKAEAMARRAGVTLFGTPVKRN